MSTRSTVSTVVAVLVFGLSSLASARAEGLGIKGVVKGGDGKPLAGAQVQAVRVDGKGPVVNATTNGKGEYVFPNLDLAFYRVVTVVNKVPKQIASIKTRTTAWVRVDFDLTATAKTPTKKRLVWVAGDTGTHIGSGHWEEVEDGINGKGANPVQRVDGTILANPNALNPAAGVSGPGH